MAETSHGEVQALADRVRAYSESYHAGNPEISDDAFDLLVEQLRRMDPNNPVLLGVSHEEVIKTDVGDRKPHRHGAFRPDETVIRRASDVRMGQEDFVIVPKVIGETVVCYYERGRLDLSLTRGDGVTGTDVTGKMRYLVPDTLADHEFTGLVLGEVTMSVGILESKYGGGDPEGNRDSISDVLLGRSVDASSVRDLSFVARTVRGSTMNPVDSRHAVFDWLRMNGFDVIDVIPTSGSLTDGSLRDAVLGYRGLRRYPVDGLVITTERYEEIGDGFFVPHREVIYKTSSETAVTDVIGMEWNLSDSGNLEPVALMRPVILSGGTARRAYLYDARWVLDSGVGVGSSVRIQRSGTPFRVIEVISAGDPMLPSECPSCGHKLAWVKSSLVCGNGDCPSKRYNRLVNWVEGIAKTRGVGRKTEEALFRRLGIRTIDDLYSRIDDIAPRPSGLLARGVERAYGTMVDLLRGEVPAERFFRACSIPGCGRATATKLGRNLDLVLRAPDSDDVRERILGIEGVNEKSKRWLADHLEDVRRWASYLSRVIPTQEVESGIRSPDVKRTVAVYGRLSVPRSDFFEEMAYHGYLESDADRASFLVTEVSDDDSQVVRDARKRGTLVMSEDSFRDMVGT